MGAGEWSLIKNPISMDSDTQSTTSRLHSLSSMALPANMKAVEEHSRPSVLMDPIFPDSTAMGCWRSSKAALVASDPDRQLETILRMHSLNAMGYLHKGDTTWTKFFELR